MSENVVTLANTPVRRGPLLRPVPKLDSDPVALAIRERMAPVTDCLFKLTGEARRLISLHGGDYSEAARMIAAELETVGIRMEVKS
jgi:hypothetical protein